MDMGRNIRLVQNSFERTASKYNFTRKKSYFPSLCSFVAKYFLFSLFFCIVGSWYNLDVVESTVWEHESTILVGIRREGDLRQSGSVGKLIFYFILFFLNKEQSRPEYILYRV